MYRWQVGFKIQAISNYDNPCHLHISVTDLHGYQYADSKKKQDNAKPITISKNNNIDNNNNHKNDNTNHFWTKYDDIF